MGMQIETSTTLLRDIAGAADNPRWGEFTARYRPLLEAFMSERFPGLEAEDLIQETFIAIARALPEYRYAPDEKGHFRSFLTGILHHKALNALRSSRRRTELLRKYEAEPQVGSSGGEEEQRRWRETLYEVALQQMMVDPEIPLRNKQIFERTAMKGERPQAVAESQCVSRDVVDQTKKRMLDSLRGIIEELKRADEV